jgi:hypothetical protein
MFPNPNNQPTPVRQSLVRIDVTPLVRENLGSPEIRIRFRPSRVVRAPMPKTAVNENRHLGASKDKICSATDRGFGTNIYPKSEPHLMER